MNCYACDREAQQRCPRCGNPYCPDHGAEFCDSCLAPLNAAPSRSAFRVALFGLLGGSVLALWLLVRPPSVPGESSPITRNEPTATPALTPAQGGSAGTPSPTLPAAGTGTPAATAAPTDTGAASPTTAPTEAPTPAPTEAPGPIEYTVVEGDTWFGIAEAFGVDANELAAVNGLTIDDVLSVGTVLVIPQ